MVQTMRIFGWGVHNKSTPPTPIPTFFFIVTKVNVKAWYGMLTMMRCPWILSSIQSAVCLRGNCSTNQWTGHKMLIRPGKAHYEFAHQIWKAVCQQMCANLSETTKRHAVVTRFISVTPRSSNLCKALTLYALCLKSRNHVIQCAILS